MIILTFLYPEFELSYSVPGLKVVIEGHLCVKSFHNVFKNIGTLFTNSARCVKLYHMLSAFCKMALK